MGILEDAIEQAIIDRLAGPEVREIMDTVLEGSETLNNLIEAQIENAMRQFDKDMEEKLNRLENMIPADVMLDRTLVRDWLIEDLGTLPDAREDACSLGKAFYDAVVKVARQMPRNGISASAVALAFRSAADEIQGQNT